MIDEYETDDGYECPTCDRVVNTSLGLKQHHAKVHGESLVRTAECNWCGDEFRIRPSQEGNFCSRECQMERRKSEGLEARKRQGSVTCENCGETFTVPCSRVDVRSYCDAECRSADSDATNVECEVCGDTFYVNDGRGDDARFCSQECYGRHIHENQQGAASPLWQGGQSDMWDRYGSGFTETKREQVRDRDRRRCTECGRTEADHRDEYGQRLHVHHEVDPNSSTNPAVYNAIRNLRAMCIPCHLGGDGEHGGALA